MYIDHISSKGILIYMNKGYESVETPTPITEILNGSQLREIGYDRDKFDWDPRFLPVNEGGVFKYLDVGSMNWRQEFKVYPIVKINDKIVAIGELEKSPYEENVYWIKFVSVDPQYQNKGYSSLLLEKIFQFAQQENAALLPSYFTEEGKQKLEKVLPRLAEKYSVILKEREH